MQNLTCNRYNTFTIHVSNLITAEFLLAMKFTVHKKIVKMYATWINTRTDANDQGLSHHLEGPGTVTNDFTDMKMRW